MKIVNVLREAAGPYNTTADIAAILMHDWNCLNDLLLYIADEVDSELDERYIKRPLDADGVPIRVGDLLDAPEGEEYGVVEVVELTFDGDDWYFKGEALPSFMGQAGYFNVAGWRHCYKPRTVEDMLREFYAEYDAMVHSPDIPATRNAVVVAKYADEIRGLIANE